MAIVFERNFEAPYEVLIPVAPRIRRLLANNPSPFTYKGTSITVIGEGRVVVIDPGPDDPHHLAALRAALKDETVTNIFITHTHKDHSPAARALKLWTGAKTYGFGPHPSSKREDGIVIEEGGDMEFIPDVVVRDGDVIESNGLHIECVHTPGHLSNHICYALKEEHALFSGDHVMGWSTSVIAPPDGDMGDYLASLQKLLARNDAVYWPTHGGPIRNPKAVVAAYLNHRREREAEIVACLRAGLDAIPNIVERIYVGLDPRLKPAASLTVLAHLLQLIRGGHVASEDEPNLRARFALARI
jgi:glyoxylase-like metal-dependent hydrolase (beta-lactamase superfamily II)